MDYFKLKSNMIKKAIIPVAGIGSRFLPASKTVPKEMFPLVDKPVIHYIVKEAVEAGIQEVIFVTSASKKSLEDYFDFNFELDYRLGKKSKLALRKEVAQISKMAKFFFVRQPEPAGCGDAVLRASRLLTADEAALVCWGDDVIYGKNSIKELIKVYQKHQAPILALEKIKGRAIERYGVVKAEEIKKNTYQIFKIVEKPSLESAPSDLGIVGRYILTADFFKVLAQQKPHSNGEIRTADALNSFLKQGKKMYGCCFSGKRYDCGSKLDWLKANVELGLQKKDIKKEFQNFLKNLI